MCRATRVGSRLLWGAVAAVVAAAGGAALPTATIATEPVSVQTHPASVQATSSGRSFRPAEDSLLARLREIEAQLPLARERAEAEDLRLRAARRGAVARTVDTVTVGPFRIFAEPGRVEDARSDFEAVHAEFDALLGDDRDVPRATFLYDPASVLGDLLVADGAARVTGRNWDLLGFDRASLERAVRYHAGLAVSRSYPEGFQAWVGGLGPIRYGDERDRFERHRLFILARAPAAKECIEGDLEACWDAVGLVGRPRAPDRWYDARRLDPEGRPVASRATPREALAMWHDCRRAGDDGEPCQSAFLAQPRFWMDAIPLPGTLRADLVVFALELGGPGALDRLLDRVPAGETPTVEVEVGDSTETRERFLHLRHADFATEVRAALVAAAGVSEGELMARWRESVLAARPEGVADDGSTRLATTFWIFLFTLAATRSTRWRLG